jgi:hypothetical protein
MASIRGFRMVFWKAAIFQRPWSCRTSVKVWTLRHLRGRFL